MKNLQQCLLAVSLTMSVGTCANAESITSTPSPAVKNKTLEVRIQSDQDLGSTVYCYTWCKSINGSEKTPSWTWDGVHTSKFRMTGSGGSYSFRIADIKSFYELSDTELAGLSELGFIAKNSSGAQTGDLSIQVVQGRGDAYSGGEGTPDNPFIIKNINDLSELATTPVDWAEDVYLRLDADIDASALASPIASKGSPFRGHFDGGGHVITGLRLSDTAVGEAVGLFGGLKNGEIRNLGVTGAHIDGATYAGILVGYAISGTIKACYTTGAVKATSLCSGGLVGENAGAVISDCYSGAEVISPADCAVGGLVGKNAGVVQNVYATGAVTGADYVGGVAGANYGNIRHSVALNSAVTATSLFAARFGGNNNARNIVSDNNAWSDIATGSGSWSSFGDNATLQNAGVLASFSSFRSLTGWDFESIWEWKTENGKAYPVLRNIAGQANVIPSAFYSGLTGLTDVNASGVIISAGPNPVSTTLYVKSTEEIASCLIVAVSGAAVANITATGQHEIEIDMSAACPGMYIVSVTTADGNKSVKKIIKK